MPDRRWREICLVLTDDAGIEPLCRTYFGKPRATDVVSFLYQPMPGDDSRYSADIVVNVQRAVERGKHGGADRELALYVAHGCDHLMGEDDATRAERLRMRRRELRWLRQAHARDMLAGLFARARKQEGSRCSGSS